MTQVKLTNLVSRLDAQSKRALENAAGDAMNQNCSSIEAEHWLFQLVAGQNPALMQFLDSQKISVDSLTQELNGIIQKLPRGGSGQPTLSGSLTELMKSAWLLASVDFGHQTINGLHIVLGLRQKNHLSTPFLSLNALKDISESALRNTLSGLKVATSSTARGTAAPTGSEMGDALDKYTVNLTELARQDKIDPVLGRNQEVRNVIDILCRKRQNNPILVGEPGVGKTAIVEGLARRIVNKEVPVAIQNVELRSLDLGLLQAGASVKGEFENRLKDLINEVKHSEIPIIVFIDEAHTLIGAGGAEGQNDAANLLKPALARGEFRTIAATTWEEYKKYFEKDPALTRRFQVVKVEEPSAEDAVQMLRGIAASLHDHHKVLIREDAIDAAVKLSIRYLPGRQLPDKAISLLDTSCARIALTQGATPQVIEQINQKIQYLKNELAATDRENKVFESAAYDVNTLQQEVDDLQKKREDLQLRCDRESKLVTEVIDLQKKVVIALDTQAIKNTTDENDSFKEETNEVFDSDDHRLLNEKLTELESIQKGEPLIYAMVDKNTIAQVISDWTGIPSGNMLNDEVKKLLTIEKDLHERVIGQDTAINELAKSIRISRAGLTDERKPIGVFLMCGPSGVGKTETAMALTDKLYGGDNDITIINMTEFKEEHKISMLLGAPAGYVGFGKGGVLTEAVRRNPYSVLLLDEMEKAHPSVHDLFYQIFDKGSIQDSEGRHIDFRNTIIIMTSNAADQAICDICESSNTRPEHADLVEQIRPALQQYFKPAFLGRTTVIPYYPLNQNELTQISAIALTRIRKRLEANYQAEFTYDSSFIEFVTSRNYDVTTGARGIEQIINRSLMPRLAAECLQLLSEGKTINRVHVTRETNDDFELSIS